MLSSISTVLVRPSGAVTVIFPSLILNRPKISIAFRVLEADFLTHASFLQGMPWVHHTRAFRTCG